MKITFNKWVSTGLHQFLGYGVSLTRMGCLWILRVIFNHQRIVKGQEIFCVLSKCVVANLLLNIRDKTHDTFCKIFETLNVPIVIKVAWVKRGYIITDIPNRYQYKRCPRKCIEGYRSFEDIPLFPACIASSIFKPRWPKNKYHPFLYIRKSL